MDIELSKKSKIIEIGFSRSEFSAVVVSVSVGLMFRISENVRFFINFQKYIFLRRTVNTSEERSITRASITFTARLKEFRLEKVIATKLS